MLSEGSGRHWGGTFTKKPRIQAQRGKEPWLGALGQGGELSQQLRGGAAVRGREGGEGLALRWDAPHSSLRDVEMDNLQGLPLRVGVGRAAGNEQVYCMAVCPGLPWAEGPAIPTGSSLFHLRRVAWERGLSGGVSKISKKR